MQRRFLHDRFRLARMKLFSSQRKFAAAMKQATGRNIGQAHISAIERGVNTPSVEMLIAAASLLDVTPDWLLGFETSQQIQEMTRLLAELPAEDVELVRQLIQRLADHRARQDNEWRSLWRDVLAMGGQDLVGRFERLLGISAPGEIRSATGVDKIDQPPKAVERIVTFA